MRNKKSVLMTLNHNCGCSNEAVAGIAANGFGLGEVAFVRWLVCRKAILPNPCYAYVAVNLG
jgi:hypothetical protein